MMLVYLLVYNDTFVFVRLQRYFSICAATYNNTFVFGVYNDACVSARLQQYFCICAATCNDTFVFARLQ
jgi:hypothetical protein